VLFACLFAIASLFAIDLVQARSTPPPALADMPAALAVDSLPDVREFQVLTLRLSAREALACGVVTLTDGRVGVTSPALQLRHADTGHTLVTYVDAALKRCETPLRTRGINVTSRERYDVSWRVSNGARLTTHRS